MKKLQSYLMLFIFALSLVPAFLPVPVKAQEGLTELVMQPDGNSGYDSYISSVNTTTVYETSQTMLVGEMATNEVGRGLITWDFSALPSDAAIETATLSLWVAEDLATNASTLQVYPVMMPWDEEIAHWVRYRLNPVNSTDDNWQTPGASGANDLWNTTAAEVVLTADMTTGTQVDITLDTEMVGHIVRNNFFGFLLKSDDETSDAYTFYTSDATDDTKRPKLTITYNPSPVIDDPGWWCVDGDVTCEDFLDNETIYSPFYHETPEEQARTNFGGQWDYEGNYAALGAKINCEPYPRCRNDYPIYYTVKYTYEWTSQSQYDIYATTTVKVNAIGGDVVAGKSSIACREVEGYSNHGICKGIMRGVIQPEEIPDEGNGEWDVYLKTNIAYFTGYPVSAGVLWDFALSRREPEPTCSDTYTVPEIDTYVIDPTIETPVGMVPGETFTDEQGYILTPNSMYMLRVQDGPWYDGTNPEERYDTEVSFDDGATYMPLQELVSGGMEILCYDVSPINPWWITIYFTAPSDAVYIRVNDTEGGSPNNYDNDFANNTNNSQTPINYSIGLAQIIGDCGEQFQYDEITDHFSSIIVDAQDLATSVNNSYTNPLTPSDWYGIEVVDDSTWHEDTPPDPRDDMEFSYYVPAPPVGHDNQIVAPFTDWADLAEGSQYVYCETTSPNGTIVYIQAPQEDGLSIKLHVNDQDIPQNFADNVDNLHVNVYHVTFTYIPDPDACDANYIIGDLVDSNAVDGGAANGKAFGNSLSMIGSLFTSYDLIPDGWYMLQTKDGPWTAGTTDETYTAGMSYYDVQLKSTSELSNETWKPPDEWPLASLRDGCVAIVDGLGHVRVFFRAPAVGEHRGTEEHLLRAAGAELNSVGSMGWDLYEVAEGGAPDPWNTCIDTYNAGTVVNNKTWIPVKYEEGVDVTKDNEGDGITTLQPGLIYKLNTLDGPWFDGESEDERWTAQLSSDGGVTWYLFENHPDVECYSDRMFITAVFTMQTGQYWKIRVADTETEIFADNTGNLAYQLRVTTQNNPPGDDDDWINGAFDVCAQTLVRPQLFHGEPFIEWANIPIPVAPGNWDVSDWVGYLADWFYYLADMLNESTVYVGEGITVEVTNYISSWFQYLGRTVLAYFAWCPRHTELLVSSVNELVDKEPLATVDEMDTIVQTTINEVNSYNWGPGGEGGGVGSDGYGYEDTSIFSFGGEGGGISGARATVDTIFEKILPTKGQSVDVWEGGNIVDFGGSSELPEFYYTCESAFADYLPGALRTGTCFVSAYWKETGAAFWMQLSFDIFTIFLLFRLIKSSAQSLIYMMTGVRPWTKDGALRVIVNTAERIKGDKEE